MSFSNGLKYEKQVDKNIQDVLAKGLVHMFEFNGKYEKYLTNFCNAINGKNSGTYSTSRENNIISLGFDENKQLFQALPTSAVGRNGEYIYPLRLYDVNDVGFIIDPKKVEFIIVEPHLCSNHIQPGNRVGFYPLTSFLNGKFNETNTGTDGHEIQGRGFRIVPLHRSEKDHAAVKNLFENDLWQLYSGGFKSDTAEFKNHFNEFIKDSQSKLGWATHSLLSEIIINCPPSAIKGIILTSLEDKRFTNPRDMHKKYAPIKETRSDTPFYRGDIMLAALTQMALKQRGIDLPIIHYSCLEPTEELVQPTIKQVKVEMKKVINVLKNDETTHRIFESVLGKNLVQNMVLGKEDFSIA